MRLRGRSLARRCVSALGQSVRCRDSRRDWDYGDPPYFPLKSSGHVKPGSSGTPVPGYEAIIVDEGGRPVPRGEIGNLRVKGDSTMAYYWNRDEKTKETLFGPWIQTGDKYYQDEEGDFWY